MTKENRIPFLYVVNNVISQIIYWKIPFAKDVIHWYYRC